MPSKQFNTIWKRFMLSTLLLALCPYSAWPQAAPPFSISGDMEYGSQATPSTSPGVTVFHNQLVALWCGKAPGKFMSFLQSSPTATPSYYSSGISCSNNGTPSAASGIALAVDPVNSTIYAASQLFSQSFGEPVLLSSTDGIHWSSHTVTINDLVFAYGYGIEYFQGELYLAYVGQNGLSVATSSDGVNFTYKSSIPSYPLESESSGWLQSPTLYYWTNTGLLYIGYLTTGSYVVVGHTADGTNWSMQEYTTTILNHDLVLVPHDNALYFGGQSYYSEDTLWMAGAYDGVSFPAATNYGGSMGTSPSAVDFNGTFYMLFKSNFSDYMWNVYATN